MLRYTPSMLDEDLFAAALRSKGHTVAHIHKIPDNAGEYEVEVDGRVLTLEQARALLEEETA